MSTNQQLNNNKLKCQYCTMIFRKLYQLMKHCRTYHGNEYIYAQCIPQNLVQAGINQNFIKNKKELKKLKALNNLVNSPFVQSYYTNL